MAYQRYCFDRSFGERREAPPPPREEVKPVDPLDVPRHSERALQAALAGARREAMAEGVARGRREGEAQARERVEADLAGAVGRLLDELAGLEERHGALMARLEAHGAALIVALVGRLAPGLLAANARADVERAAGDALRAAGASPELQLRVHPDLQDALDRRLGAMAADAGFRGRIEVVADDGLARGALDAAWDAGGLRRDPAELERALAAVVERTLGTLADAGGTAPLGPAAGAAH
ncbi:flagellar assembly protein FliH [Azospirillum sp. ST 5-10]|uniref:flagellar assembly protein FliH n=1 Tax=unclassified Azospirillum TaxID=2630922 RepID=UPI003F4A740E